MWEDLPFQSILGLREPVGMRRFLRSLVWCLWSNWRYSISGAFVEVRTARSLVDVELFELMLEVFCRRSLVV